METMEQYNERFMRENPQYTYATPSVAKNISTTATMPAEAKPSYQGGEMMPAVGTQAYIDAQTMAKMAPTTFRTNVPTHIPTDALSPTNTVSDFTSKVDDTTSRLLG